MNWRRARYCAAAAWASLCFGAAFAATPTCRSDADCSPPATLCRSFSLTEPPQRLCIPPIPATAVSTDGANYADRGQEQRITAMLAALSERVDALQPRTLSELRDVLDREVRAGRLDEATLKREMSQAHAALLQLDHYERLVLARYLKRQFSTEFERWLFIILDIIRHPDLEPSTEIAALDSRIAAEQLRVRGMTDKAARCAQLSVIVQLKRQKWAATLAREVRRIEASNVSPERREALTENARRWTRHAEETESVILLGDCGGNAALPGPVAVPQMPAAAKPERPRYMLYSLDPPEMVALADAVGVPPVGSGAWPSNVGKRFTKPPNYAGLQPYDEDGKSLDRRYTNTGFFRWFFNMMAENLAVEAIHHYTHIKLDPLPPSMVNKVHVAQVLAKFPKTKTSREVACLGAALHKELTVPFAPNIGERINLLTQSMLPLKDPSDPNFADCREQDKK